jgi:pSer/pThr/pTyr-binding forkhead associated (FHA) protein
VIVVQPEGGAPSSYLGAFTIGAPAPAGRAAPATLQLGGPGVSLLHCQVAPSALGWTVVDLASAAGTLLNGVPVSRTVPCRLRKGDRLTLGSLTLIVVPDPP